MKYAVLAKIVHNNSVNSDAKLRYVPSGIGYVGSQRLRSFFKKQQVGYVAFCERNQKYSSQLVAV